MKIKSTRFDISLSEDEVTILENILEYTLVKLRSEDRDEVVENSIKMCQSLLSMIEGRKL